MNVVVIVTDSLRMDHTGCYGNKWVHTPCIDRLARESLLIRYAYSEGLPTLPVRTAWWTGKYTFPFRAWQPFEREDALLAELFWNKGYSTALITDVWHLHEPGYDCLRGFDYVEFIRGQEYDKYVTDPSVRVEVDKYFKPRADSPKENERYRRNLEQYLRNTAHWRTEEDHFAPQVVKATIRWLERQPRLDNLFAWVDMFDPHEPWDPPEPYVELYDPGYKGKVIIDAVPGPVANYLTDAELGHIRALYAGEVTMVDRWVGILLDKMRELGMFDNSLVVYTSDHGHPLGHHGIIRKSRPWLHEELVRIPLLIRHPDGLGAGKCVDGMAETCDLMPTILDFLGLQGPPGMHGKSLIPLLRGEASQVRDFAYCGWHKRSWSIKNREWSFILPLFLAKPRRDWTHAEEPRAPELYRLTDDPDELKNVIGKYPDVAARLELELRRFVDTLVEEGRVP